MAQDSTHLIWIDLEMSGLRPDSDRILEVALVVTTQQLEVVAEGPVRVVHQSEAVLDAMDSWNKSTHARTGLVDLENCTDEELSKLQEAFARLREQNQSDLRTLGDLKDGLDRTLAAANGGHAPDSGHK